MRKKPSRAVNAAKVMDAPVRNNAVNVGSLKLGSTISILVWKLKLLLDSRLFVTITWLTGILEPGQQEDEDD
jgi:hypothetical protein